VSSGRVLPFRPRAGGPAFDGHGAAPALRHRGGESPFRRPRGAIRHLRRGPLLRFGRPLLAALAIVGAPAAAAAWILVSPRFALRDLDVRVEPGGRVSAAWVRQALRPAVGLNLPRLPLEWVDAALSLHPWVRGADVRKQLPDQLVVEVIEKREVALGRGDAGDPGRSDGPALWYLDADGERIAPMDPADGETDLVLVSGRAAAGLRPALALRQEIDAVAPGWAAALSEIEVLGEQDFRVWSADLPFPLLVRSGTLAGKNGYLEALLPEILRRYGHVAAVDLRFTRRIILQPSARGRGAAGGPQKG
jgi:hypothetical protein